MKKLSMFISAVAVVGLLAASLQAEPSKNFRVFLCFGQSNMSGGTQVGMDSKSQEKHPRIKVLAFENCGGPSRTKNQWYEACEPMHCGDGINPTPMGPSYAFGQALIDSLPAGDTIGLIPAGLWAVKIEMFMKGGNYTGQKPSISGIGNCAWDWMLTKCKKAVERGVFSGIILEQGESNSGEQTWPGKVKAIYDSLKKYIPFTKDVPLVAGELLQASGACCSGHNTVVAQIPSTFPANVGYVASSKDLTAGGDQKQYHFSQSGYRTLGQRFAVQMMKGLRALGLIDPSATLQPQRLVSATTVKSQRDNAKVYSLDGRFISNGAAMAKAASFKPGHIYVVANKATGSAAKLMIASTH